jgi:hypothetical protein
MMTEVILDLNLNAGWKSTAGETRQRNLNRHAEGLIKHGDSVTFKCSINPVTDPGPLSSH